MSHQAAAIAIPKDRENDYQDYIAETLEPHYYGNVHSHLYWDWYTIGGRWDSAYFPTGENTGPACNINRDLAIYTYIGLDRTPFSRELYQNGNFHSTPGFDSAYLMWLDSIPPNTIIAIVDYHN